MHGSGVGREEGEEKEKGRRCTPQGGKQGIMTGKEKNTQERVGLEWLGSRCAHTQGAQAGIGTITLTPREHTRGSTRAATLKGWMRDRGDSRARRFRTRSELHCSGNTVVNGCIEWVPGD